MLEVLERANQIASTGGWETLMDQMVQLMIEIAGGDAGVLYLFDQEAEELIFAIVKDALVGQNLVGLRIKQDQGIVGASVTTGEPIIVHHLLQDSRWLLALDPILSSRWQSAITLPLKSKGNLIGAIQIYNFHRTDLELLQVLGGRFATDIERLLSLESASLSNHRLTALISVLGQVGGTLDRETILRFITEQTTHLLNAERSSVFLIDPQTNNVVQNVSYQAQNPEVDYIPTLSFQEVLRKAARSKNFTYHSQLFPQGPKKTKIRGQSGFVAQSAVTVPLQSGSISLGRPDKESHILGGLMALNKRGTAFSDEDAHLLEILANQASVFVQVTDLYKDANELFIDVIKALVASIDAKDPFTQGHSLRVSEFSVSLAEELGLPQDFIKDLQIGSLLHDVGKIGIPDHILLKPGRLTDAEYEIIKKQPTIGSTIMRQVRLLQAVLPAIEQHHERLDGSGYPLGLRGEQISLMGRIVGVADVYDAMTADRPYRPALPSESVLEYLLINAETLFDSDCVQALLRVEQRERQSFA
jgi:HD-GYP domain-containing protein (c-di-GMP phosphodiesterase class II)